MNRESAVAWDTRQERLAALLAEVDAVLAENEHSAGHDDPAEPRRYEDWPQRLLAENQHLRAEVEQLRDIVAAKTGGETPGQTLMRLSRLVLSVRRVDGVGTADWRLWLYDFGARMSEACRVARVLGLERDDLVD